MLSIGHLFISEYFPLIFAIMIVSYDSIMKPPYNINSDILKLATSISAKLGELKANYLERPIVYLRKQNKIKTIHASLWIEGNTLSLEQITAIIDNKPVLGPRKDILEVQYAIKVYDNLKSLDPFSEKSFLDAHKILLTGLVDKAGSYRQDAVGVLKGNEVVHVAPPAKRVPLLMGELFDYLKRDSDLLLIKSCVFHYEAEFIHPFMDGNGRMGRLWQTLILMKDYPIFEYLPFETLIAETQSDYYQVLQGCDDAGDSTLFVEYMLSILDRSLSEILDYKNRTISDVERLDYYVSSGVKSFSRKDYMGVFKDISTATASRDLKKGVEMKLFKKSGDKNKTLYSIENED